MHTEGKEMDQQKKSFLMGLGVGVGILVVLGGVFMLGSRFGGGSGFGGGGDDDVVAQPANPQPTQPGAPVADQTKIAKVSNADHVRGGKNAKVTLIEYSDFECPFCARFHPTVQQALQEYGDKIRVVYRHFPLRSIHPNAQKAAEASECASEQGKFWEMHDKLFDLNTARTLTLDMMKSTAKDLGLDTGKFNDCLDSGKTAPEVEKDYQDGIAGGVTGTPGTFIEGDYIPGALPYEQIKGVIDQKLS